MEPPGHPHGQKLLRARSAGPFLVGASVLLCTGCLEQPATFPSEMTAQLAMAVAVRASDALQASYLDAWRVQVSRPGTGVIAEESGTMGPEEASVEAQTEVTLESTCETLQVGVELSSGGEVWLRAQGSHQICVGGGNLIEIQELEFVRPRPVVTPSELGFVIQQGRVDTGSFSIGYSGRDGLAWAAGVQESGVTWLSLPTSSGFVTAGQPQNVEVAVNAEGLSPGGYSAHVAVTGEGFPDPIGSVSVSLTVTEQPRIGLSTGSLSFTAEEGSNPGAQVFSVENAGGGTLTWTTSADAAWIALSPSSGTLGAGAAATVTVSLATGDLEPGSYSGDLTVAATDASNSPQTISVSLTVLAGPRIGLSTHTLSFSAPEGGSPDGQVLTVANAGGGVLSWEAAVDSPWLTIVPRAGSLGTEGGLESAQDVTVSVESESLSPGDYTGSITFTAPDAFNTPQAVFVLLSVKERTPPTLSNLVYELRVLNDTTCFNSGSRFDVFFDYVDADGDVPVAGGSFVGEPLRFEWQFLPDGHSGESLIDTDVEGDGFNGRAHLDLCIAYEIPGNTSVGLTFSLRDTWPLWSDPVSLVIPRPTGAHVPPTGGS